jgi:hypothetical protein
LRPTSDAPTKSPTQRPTSDAPTKSPTLRPTSDAPTKSPTLRPTSDAPTKSPTQRPTSDAPTKSPTLRPTSNAPTKSPTLRPTSDAPTKSPTLRPSSQTPSRSPTFRPSSQVPSRSPTSRPVSSNPSRSPTKQPSRSPTLRTTASPAPRCTESETGWAKATSNAVCFNALGESRWGWTNGPFTRGTSINFDIWLGAGKCDTSKAVLGGKGTLTVDDLGGGSISYSITNANVAFTGVVKAYIGSTQLTSVSPGQMPITVLSNPYTFSGVPSSFYFYIHYDAEVSTPCSSDDD